MTLSSSFRDNGKIPWLLCLSKELLNLRTSWYILYPWFVLILLIFNAFDHTSCFPQRWFVSEIWNCKVFLLAETWARFKVSRVFWRSLAPDHEAGMETLRLGSSGFCLSARKSPPCKWGPCCVFGSPWSCNAMGCRRDGGESMPSPGRGFSTCRYSRVWLRFGDRGICVMPETFLKKCLTLLKDLG